MRKKQQTLRAEYTSPCILTVSVIAEAGFAVSSDTEEVSKDEETDFL